MENKKISLYIILFISLFFINVSYGSAKSYGSHTFTKNGSYNIVSEIKKASFSDYDSISITCSSGTNVTCKNGIITVNNFDAAVQSNTSLTISLSITATDPSGGEEKYTGGYIVILKKSSSSSNFKNSTTTKENGKCCIIGTNNYKWASNSSCGMYSVKEGVTSQSACENYQEKATSSDACYKHNASGTYFWGDYSNDKNYTLDSSATVKKTCTSKNESKSEKDSEEDTLSSDSSRNSATNLTGMVDTGDNACTSYTIYRRRGYNCGVGTEAKKLKEAGLCTKDTDFNSPVASGYNYYYIYEAISNCGGSTAVKTFCIDAGLEGPTVEGTPYTVQNTKLETGTALFAGLYRLYTKWYLEGGINGSEDHIDFVLNNVARKLVAMYGTGTPYYMEEPNVYKGDGKYSSLWTEWKAYKTNSLTGDAGEVWNDVVEYAEDPSKVDSAGAYTVFQIDSNSSSKSSTGFSANVDVTIKSVNKELLTKITNGDSSTFSVSASTLNSDGSTGSATIESSDITSTGDLNGWTMSTETQEGSSSTLYVIEATFAVKASVSDADNISSASITFHLNYTDPTSISNIQLLTTNKYGKTTGKNLQKFIVFMNGVQERVTSVNIPFTSSNNNCTGSDCNGDGDDDTTTKKTCKPTFTMPCEGKEAVYYLVEGTKSSNAFNYALSGIQSVDDLKTLASDSKSALTALQNAGTTSATSTQITTASSLIYNVAQSVGSGVAKSITGELISPLKTLAANGNKTAEYLATALESALEKGTLSSSDQATTTKTLTNLITGVITNGLTNGYSKLQSEWKEIVNMATDSKTISNTTSNLLENVGNYIASAASDAGTKLINSAANTLVNYFVNSLIGSSSSSSSSGTSSTTSSSSSSSGTSSTTSSSSSSSSSTDSTSTASQASSIMSKSLSLSSFLSTATGSVSSLIESANNLLSEVTNADNYTLSNLYDTITSAFTVDWENCIIDNKDPAGNEYTVQTENMYCTIVCKEDYAFYMPGNLSVTQEDTIYQGRYISTNVNNIYHATIGVAGQRTCVTTEIDSSKFKEEAVSSKDDMIDSLNDYNEATAKFQSAQKQGTGDSYENAIQNKANYTEKQTVDTSDTVENLKSKLNSKIKDIISNFIRNIVGTDSDENITLGEKLVQKFAANSGNAVSALIVEYLQGKLTSDTISGTIKSALTLSIEDATTEVKNKINNAFSELKTDLYEGVMEVIGEAGSDLLGMAGEAAGKTALQLACSAGPEVVSLIPYVGAALSEGLEWACNTYASVSTAFANGIIEISEATDGTINAFDYDTAVDYDYTYKVVDYEDDSDEYTKLSSDLENKDTESGSDSTESSKKTIWPMSTDGSYSLGTLNFGTEFNIDYLEKGIEALQEVYDIGTTLLGTIESGMDAVKSAADSMSSTPSLDNIKKMATTLDSSNISTKLSTLSSAIESIVNLFTSFKNIATTASSEVSDLIDTAVDAYYYIRGAFSKYYASLASLREEMNDAEEDYEEAEAELYTEASSMNSCTVWDKAYNFSPEITFDYGYNTGTYDKVNSTTDKITLEAINMPDEADVTTYYCDSAVEINNIQNAVLTGECSTDDGILGSVLTSLAGEDSTAAKAIELIQDNSELLSNTKVVQAIKDSGICDNNTLAEDLCKTIGASEDGEASDGTREVKVSSDIIHDYENIDDWQTVLSNLFEGITTLDFSKVEEAISETSIYTNLEGVTIKYRDSGRVATVSRYGNPGISISGMSLSSVVSNTVSAVSGSYDNSEAVDKANEAIMSTTGQGTQSFIYFRSSTPYWTSSNKGIYTKTETGDEPVYADEGDPAITNEAITTADDSTKEPEGKVYPIALSTEEGTYDYIITINNVGQYYTNTQSLGRIVDNNGYFSGLMQNKYVCNYTVKKEPTPDDDCASIAESATCKDGDSYFGQKYSAAYKKNPNASSFDSESSWSSCVTTLINTGVENKVSDYCCSYVKGISTDIPSSASELYDKYCKNPNGTPDNPNSNDPDNPNNNDPDNPNDNDPDNPNDNDPDNPNDNNRSNCKGISIYGLSSSYSSGGEQSLHSVTKTDSSSSSSNSAAVTSSGTLTFSTKVISNYDYFPNGTGSKGYVWTGTTSGYENGYYNSDGVYVPGEKTNLADWISEKEEVGDGIYAEENEDVYLDYSVDVSPACTSLMREYNDQQEINDLGFGDYTLGSISKESRNYKSQFLAELESNSACKVLANNLSKDGD